MKPDPITIRITTLPDRALWPNTGAHRRTKEPYVAVLRLQAALSTHNALNGNDWSWNGPIETRIDVYWPSHLRILDWTNIHAALKPAEDGIFDKLDANDRQVQTVTLKQHKLPKGWDGYLLYTIIALEE
jgi:hypothetical protein